jgi:DNA-binding transcriptional MerR regulator
MDSPAVVESYTIPEAAEAIGKSLNAFRRWISDELIPSPYLLETSSGYRVYSRGELDIIAHALQVHGQEFSYFRSDHTTVIHQINQRIQAFRSMHI